MTLYVDPPREQPTNLRHKVWSHLVSDVGPIELNAMAKKIGLKPEWSQEPPKASQHHYDVTPPYRLRAIAAGAKEVSARELVKLSYDGLYRRRLIARQIAGILYDHRGWAVNETILVAAISKDRDLRRPLPSVDKTIDLLAGALVDVHPNLTLVVRSLEGS